MKGLLLIFLIGLAFNIRSQIRGHFKGDYIIEYVWSTNQNKLVELETISMETQLIFSEDMIKFKKGKNASWLTNKWQLISSEKGFETYLDERKQLILIPQNLNEIYYYFNWNETIGEYSNMCAYKNLVKYNSLDKGQLNIQSPKTKPKGSYYGNPSDASEYCRVRVDAVNSFSSNQEAEYVLNQIILATGISKRFALYQCNGIDNCEALTFRGVRYIFYDARFMKMISQKTGNYWSNISILAHEVGHHVNAHTIDILSYASGEIEPSTLAEKRQMEIEADEFSGFVLYKLGASLADAQSAINKFGDNGDDSYSTHPNKTKRLNAIARGYNKAKSQSDSYRLKTLTAEDYFYRAYNTNNKNFKYIIDNYSKALRINPELTAAYINRGYAYHEKGMYREALNDFNRAIQLDPYNDKAYNNRGRLFSDGFKKYQLAIDDFNNAIKLNPKNTSAYNNRGVVYKLFDGAEDIAIKDFNMAISLDARCAAAYCNRGTVYVKSNIKKYNLALKDFNKAIQIDPDYATAYNNRGAVKYQLGLNGCPDLKKALSMGYDVHRGLYKEACD